MTRPAPFARAALLAALSAGLTAGALHAHAATPPVCSELETTLGLSGSACGHLSADAVLRLSGAPARR